MKLLKRIASFTFIISFLFSMSSVAFAQGQNIPNENYSQAELIEYFKSTLSPSQQQIFSAKINTADDVCAYYENGAIVISYQNTVSDIRTRAGVRRYTKTRSKNVVNLYDQASAEFELSVTFLETNNGLRVEVESYEGDCTQLNGYMTYSNKSRYTVVSPVESGSAYVTWTFYPVSSTQMGVQSLAVTSEPV